MTLGNAALNDFFQNFTFGSAMVIRVTFSGPALDNPVSANTTTFAFSLHDASFTPLLTTDPFGFLVKTEVGAGAIVSTNLGPEFAQVDPIPEPGTLGLVLASVALLVGRVHRKRP